MKTLLAGCLAVMAVSALAASGPNKAEPDDERGTKVELPFVLYANGEESDEMPWRGWMGNMTDLEYDHECTDRPRQGSMCIKVTYNSTSRWAGIAWIHEKENWGNHPGGYDLTGAQKVTFWARGDKGGEMVAFKMGIFRQGERFRDSDGASMGTIRLTYQWKQYSIRLANKDLTCIKTPFVFALAGAKEPVTFYLDEIQVE